MAKKITLLCTALALLVAAPSFAGDAKAALEAYINVWNTGELGGLDSVATEDLVFQAPGYSAESLVEHKVNLTGVRDLYDALKVEIRQSIVEGDRAAILWKVTGTRKDSGIDIDIDGVSFFSLKDGKIAKELQFFDLAGLYRQLGYTITPPAPPAPAESQ